MEELKGIKTAISTFEGAKAKLVGEARKLQDLENRLKTEAVNSCSPVSAKKEQPYILLAAHLPREALPMRCNARVCGKPEGSVNKLVASLRNEAFLINEKNSVISKKLASLQTELKSKNNQLLLLAGLNSSEVWGLDELQSSMRMPLPADHTLGEKLDESIDLNTDDVLEEEVSQLQGCLDTKIDSIDKMYI